MPTAYKQQTLKKYKALATGLFILMTIIFLLSSILLQHYPYTWLGYIKAFSEAAMVGALADWFAVTAIFNYPLGLQIPHTNLIENSKKRIGDNLGNFVVENFISHKNIRPHIEKLDLSNNIVKWLQNSQNNELLISEIRNIASDILHKIDDTDMAKFISSKMYEILPSLPLNNIAANTLQYLIDKEEHKKFVTILSQKIKNYISTNHSAVEEKVHQESYFFIPEFVDRKLAEKITKGLVNYFGEIETDTNHKVREEIDTQLLQFINNLRNNPEWINNLNSMAANFMQTNKLSEYSLAFWKNIKANLIHEFKMKDSALMNFIAKTIDQFSHKLQTDKDIQQKLNSRINFTIYKLILRNRANAALLISNTVGNWQGRELSKKLELEVGRDLQFIRINGTIVGGIVGLILHIISKLIAE